MTSEALPPGAAAADAGQPEEDSGPRTSAVVARAAPAAHGGDYAGEVHEYDGIVEHDNHLPNWWLWILYGTMAFAMGYWFYFHGLSIGQSATQRYDREMAADYAAAAERARSVGTMTPEALVTLSRDGRTVAEGRETFQSTCAPCHGPSGGGTIGPNLTDEYWLHGGAPDRVYRTVMEGVLARGMPAWGPQQRARRVQSVVAYLLTIKNSHASGRPAQGEREP